MPARNVSRKVSNMESKKKKKKASKIIETICLATLRAGGNWRVHFFLYYLLFFVLSYTCFERLNILVCKRAPRVRERLNKGEAGRRK